MCGYLLIMAAVLALLTLGFMLFFMVMEWIEPYEDEGRHRRD